MDVYWIPFYEDVQIFLSTPFETLPDQKISGSNRTDKSENSEKFPPGVFTPAWNPEYEGTKFVLKSRILEISTSGGGIRDLASI